MSDKVKRLRILAEEGYRFAGEAAEELESFSDRLEAAEKERALDEQRIADLMTELNRVGYENVTLRADKATLQQMAYCLKDRLEAAEKERDAAELMSLALRAKIEQMEKQEPVAEWTENRFHHYPQLDWAAGYKAVIGAKLYALPGAKGE